MRTEQFLTSLKTEAILLAYKKKLYTLNVCALGFDLDVDENEEHPVISGALGDEVATSLPAYISRDEATSDFLFLGTIEETQGFLCSDTLAEKYFKGSNDAVDKPITRPFPGDVVIARIPMCLPKLRGVSIIEGLISDDTVSNSMENYHPQAASWLAIQSKISKSPNLVLTETRVKLLDESLIPKVPHCNVPLRRTHKLDLTLMVGVDYAANILTTNTATRILAVNSNNTDAFKIANPDLYPVATPTQTTTLPTSLEASDDATQASDQALIDKKYMRAMAGKMLLLARVSDDEPTVTLPEFREEFLSVLQESSKDLLVRLYRSGVTDFAHDRQQDSRDYFTRMIRLGIWNNCTVNLWVQDYLHDKPLDEAPHLLKQYISMLNFLAQSFNTNDEEFAKYLSASTREEMETLVGESTDKKAKIGLETYIGGQQDRPEDVVTAMANLEAHLAYMEDFDTDDDDNKPLLVQMLRKIADIITSQKFMKFVDKYNSQYPWIPHTLLVYVQMIFAEFATIARNNRYIAKVLKGDVIPASAYDRVQEIFRDCIRDLTKASTLQSYLPFQTKPGSYVNKKRQSRQDSAGPNNPDSDPSKTKRRRVDTSKGWFTATGPVRFPLSERICNRFGQIGSFCKEGGNCPYKHKIFPAHFSPVDIQKIIDYISSNKDVSFATHINLDELSAKLTTPQSDPPKTKQDSEKDADATGAKASGLDK